jgi:predicted Zn-dependent protease
VEEQADLTGADICSAAGYNSWGLVWLFQDFENAKVGDVPELLSDYPNNQHRVDALKQHFHKEPSVFGKFNSDQASAKPFSVSKDTPVVFLR